MIRILIITSLFFSLSLSRQIIVGFDTSSMVNTSQKDVKIATELLMENILVDLDLEADFKYYSSLAKMSEDVNNGKVDYISLNPLKAIQHFNLNNLEKAFGEGKHNKRDAELIILVRKELKVKSWKDLKNKKILFNKKNPLHQLYIDYALLSKDLEGKVHDIHSIKYKESILKLFFKKGDAAVVTRKSYTFAIEFNPQVAKRIVIFEETGLSDTQLGFFRKSLDEETKKIMAKAAKNFGSTILEKQILAIYKTEILIETDLNMLNPARELQSKYNKLKKEKGMK